MAPAYIQDCRKFHLFAAAGRAAWRGVVWSVGRTHDCAIPFMRLRRSVGRRRSLERRHRRRRRRADTWKPERAGVEPETIAPPQIAVRLKTAGEIAEHHKRLQDS